MPTPANLPQMPDLGLTDQVAIVTGASSGLGRACALALGQAGATVEVNHLPRTPSEAGAGVATIAHEGGPALALATLIRKGDQAEALFEAARREFGTVHILINNAGVQDGAPFQDMTLAQWRRVIDINLTGQFLCARAAVREFLRRGMQPEISCALGKIICMSSVHQ